MQAWRVQPMFQARPRLLLLAERLAHVKSLGSLFRGTVCQRQVGVQR